MARETPYIVVALLIIAVGLFIFLVPHRPPELQVVSVNTSPIFFTPYISNNHPSTLMSATWNLTFIATNPNKRLQLHYTDVNVAVYYQYWQWPIELSSLKLAFFKQSGKSAVVGQVSVTNFVIVSDQIAAAMGKDGLQDLSMNLIVRFRGTVRVYIGTFIIGRHDLSIDCDDVKVVFSPQNGTGRMLDPTRKCVSNHFKF